MWLNMENKSFLFIFLLFFSVIWVVIWKGFALWKAARLGRKWWFIILLVFNTFGILEIIYYFFLDKDLENKEIGTKK
jgi:Na+/H+ antiporter NhaC